MFYQTGIRLSELIELKDENVASDRIKVFGKRQKERIVPISQELADQCHKNLELDNSTGSANSNLYSSQINSDIEVLYNNPDSTTLVNNIGSVYLAYLNSKITILSSDTYTYNNINVFINSAGGNNSIHHRCQTSTGVFKTTNVNSKSGNTLPLFSISD
jgi:integrase